MPNIVGKSHPEIDFIADWNDLNPFSDLSSVAKVDNLPRMLDQWSQGMGGAERAVGRVDMAEATLISVLAERSRAVCRLFVPAGFQAFDGSFGDGPWVGTGFLVAPNILLTNYHVLNSREVAKAASAEFNYQISRQDLLDGPPDVDPAAVRFKLDPDRLFITSRFEDFDYSFVWIDDAAARQFGTIPMTRGSFMARQTEPTYVVHHPGGRRKKASLDDTEVLGVNAGFLLYAADTEGGSSGAPVFCKRGRLAALHHAWWPVSDIKSRFPTLSGRMNDGGVTQVVNEGIKLAAIAIDLEGRIAEGGPDASAAATVLSAFEGSDTMTGMFGSLGRRRYGETTDAGSATESDGATVTAYEKLVTVYEGTAQDIDIGAWNIEWLNRDHEQDRLERVAAVITDLNLDIWALSEVSRTAVDALVKVLKDKFRQDFKAAYSEPASGTGKQATAVIWRPNVLECTREDWPDELDQVLRSHSRDDQPFEAVHGRIFNRYPGLFRVRLKSTEKDFDFYLVPLHLKAKGEGSLRRELASKALSYAVDQMINVHGKDTDWILLGDVNATLKSGDFDALQNGGFTALGAKDEENGAFTYLKSPYKSLIDNIFVSQSMSRVAGADDFYIIETDRDVSRFVKNTSDHWPVAMRLSLADLPDAKPGAPAETGVKETAQEIFDRILSRAGLRRSSPRRTDTRGTPPDSHGWMLEGRDKIRFFADNRAGFEDRIAKVNATQRVTHGAGHQPLTIEDVAVVYMAEAGLAADGTVDPGYVHSNGEIGLFPLPGNIAFWIGENAPAYNRPMPLDVNIRAYLAYLGALKNKTVKTMGGRALYPGLFLEDGIAGHTDRAAKLLAGIVHGYFWDGNYGGQPVPLNHILQGYTQDLPLDEIMRPTGYVHAGKSLMKNRQRNIDEAFLRLV